MKKISVNLLKVGLLLILGLCVFSVGNEVEAVYGYSSSNKLVNINEPVTFRFNDDLYKIDGR